jgi:hypothetical protein
MADFVPDGGLFGSNFAQRAERAGAKPCQSGPTGHSRPMANPAKENPIMLPFADKTGTGWHVVVRYHHGHERRIDGFATEQEALEWIIANSKEVDE